MLPGKSVCQNTGDEDRKESCHLQSSGTTPFWGSQWTQRSDFIPQVSFSFQRPLIRSALALQSPRQTPPPVIPSTLWPTTDIPATVARSPQRKLYVGREAYETRKVPQCPVVRCLFCMCERSSSPIQRHLWTDSWLQPTGLNAQRNQEISREGTWGRDSGSSPHLPALPTHLSRFSHFLPSSRCGWEQHLPWCSVTIKLPPLLWFSKSMMMESSVTSTKVRKFLPWSVMRNQMFMDLLGSLVSWYPAPP